MGFGQDWKETWAERSRENGVLIKELLKFTWGYIVMSVTCAYVLMDQGGTCQGTSGYNILRLTVTNDINPEIMGGGCFVGEGLDISHSEWRE